MSVWVYECVWVCLYMCVCVCACVWVGYVLYDYNGSNTTKTMLTIGGLFDCIHTHILYIHTHTLCLHTGICVLTKQCTTMFHMSRGQGGGACGRDNGCSQDHGCYSVIVSELHILRRKRSHPPYLGTLIASQKTNSMLTGLLLHNQTRISKSLPIYRISVSLCWWCV